MIRSDEPSGEPDLILAGHIPPEQVQRYQSVPFAVPAGIEQLFIRYDYSDRIASDPDLVNGNTLDIGLFDERGTVSGGPGFRGWSGSARRAFVVGAEWSTPPYRAGAIEPGQWSMLLGPYKVAPQGLDYRVEIFFNSDLTDRPTPPATPRFTRQAIAPPVEPGWVRADLHSHTVFSDGDSWPIETMTAAYAAGLDVIGITDHNSAISAAEAVTPHEGGPLLVPGVETTTYGGHWNAWQAPGISGHRWYDFRDPTGPATAAAMQAAFDDGAFVSINHPKPLGPPWRYPDVTAYHAVEVWNGYWEGLNTIALAYWEDLLRRGVRKVALGGSDTHYLKQTVRRGFPVPRFGSPTTFIHIGDEPLTVASILNALRRGDCFIAESPIGPELYAAITGDALRIRVAGAAGDTLTVIGPGGGVFAAAIPADDWAATVPYPSGTSWLRVQITDRLGRVRALSQAYWRETTR